MQKIKMLLSVSLSISLMACGMAELSQIGESEQSSEISTEVEVIVPVNEEKEEIKVIGESTCNEDASLEVESETRSETLESMKDYLFPRSSEMYLIPAQVRQLSESDLRLARNEIYA